MIRAIRIDVNSLTHQEYWNVYESFLDLVNLGTYVGFLGWIFYWLSLVPDPLFRLGLLSKVFFVTATIAGVGALGIMIRTRNGLGNPQDRILHRFQVPYSILAPVLGLIVHLVYPV